MWSLLFVTGDVAKAVSHIEAGYWVRSRVFQNLFTEQRQPRIAYVRELIPGSERSSRETEEPDSQSLTAAFILVESLPEDILRIFRWAITPITDREVADSHSWESHLTHSWRHPEGPVVTAKVSHQF